ncbi:MAG: methylenetetrahydrofolate--tRNA-(uracil(54)-C(5))-methyltransferase (FADH(2)-oxidizing) TrmFO [Acidobacteriota bacterium]
MPSDRGPIHVVGGGLAGSECAFQLARRGLEVVLWEMRPQRSTPAHQTDHFAELVCSNSLRSDDPLHAAGLLKREMESFGSLIVGAARRSAVPAGGALAVDRERFAAEVATGLATLPRLTIRREEVLDFPPGDVVLATGPLTSPTMSDRLLALLGDDYLYFYDAIAPVVEADSLDREILFAASRYGKGGGDDYLNAPFTEEQYLDFHRELVDAAVVPLKDFEKKLFFEGCLPIEELARRGVDTPRFGPMKPVGLEAPDGTRPYAVVQLRQENLAKTHWNLVGFQSRLKWGEQKRVFSMIPGLENARFERMGQIHRNTFLNAPTHLDRRYRLRPLPRARVAGQLTGVEGYLESAATGLVVALYLALERRGAAIRPLPATTALGALGRHLAESDPKRFQPANINYGLFTELPGRIKKRERRERMAHRARGELAAWAAAHALEVSLQQPIEALDAPKPVAAPA